MMSKPVGALWIAISHIPTPAQISQYAGRYSVIILNSWARAAKDQIRQVNPDAKVLVYQCLSSSRNYAGAVVNGQDAPDLPTGVGWVEAQAHPEWFALDPNGNRIEWAPKYPGSWQMAVWDVGYQIRWATNVHARAAADGWDGVFADNDLYALTGYSSALFAGTTAATRDPKLRAGLAALIDLAGPILKGDGRLLVPNISNGRVNLPRWSHDAAQSGGMDEAFAHWGTNPAAGFCTDWGPSGWIGQTAELTAPLSLLVTGAAASDVVAQRYGYCSALVRAVGPVAWQPSTTGSYAAPEWFSLQDTNVGDPAGPGVQLPNGVWTRQFANAWVAVNPTTNPQTVDIPSPYAGGTVTLPAHDAVLALPA